jgi:hypothetical protein
MVLLNRYLKVFLNRNKEQKRLILYTRLAAGMELLIFFVVITFFVLRFSST